jgi:hypothetical protein
MMGEVAIPGYSFDGRFCYRQFLMSVQKLELELRQVLVCIEVYSLLRDTRRMGE